MKLQPFAIERYFAQHEFTAPYLLCCSDPESLTLAELLELADDECRSLWRNLRLSYTESQGHPLLRAEIARMYQEATADDVLVLTPEEGIFIAMNVLLQAGDHVVAMAPAYQSLHEVARGIGADVATWTPRPKGWTFRLDDLLALLTDQTKLIIINSPHNPTGATLSRETQLAIADLACARGIRVFSDEMYRLLEYDQVRRLPPMADLLPSALSLSGLSKTIGLPGLRMGWLVTQDRELLKRLATFKDYTTICHNAPSEILAIIGLRNNQALLASRMAIIQRNLALLDTFFSRQSERMSWIRPQAGPVAFPRLETGVPATTFCQRLLDDSGVLLLPGAVFDYPDDHVRIGFGRANMPEALERLEGFVRSGT